MRLFLPLIAICALAAPAAAKPRPTPEQRLAELTHGATPGEPTSCITQLPTNSSETIEGVGVVYRIAGTLYVNRFANGCDLRRTDILVTRTFSTQLCRGDIATLVDNTSRFPRGSCVYADFVPYKQVKR